MSFFTRTLSLGFAIGVAGVLAAGEARAATILQLDLGADIGADVGFNGTTLGTVPDGDVVTLGDQNSSIDYTDFLAGIPDVAVASFSLNGLTVDGTASVFGGTIVVQSFSGGTFAAYDPANVLLLSGTLAGSSLSGVIGPPGTGALFTTTLATVTGGSLMPLLDPSSFSMSLNLFDVNGGSGFSVTTSQLDGFEASAQVTIAADSVPEPAIAWLLLTGAASLIRVSRQRPGCSR